MKPGLSGRAIHELKHWFVWIRTTATQKPSLQEFETVCRNAARIYPRQDLAEGPAQATRPPLPGPALTFDRKQGGEGRRLAGATGTMRAGAAPCRSTGSANPVFSPVAALPHVLGVPWCGTALRPPCGPLRASAQIRPPSLSPPLPEPFAKLAFVHQGGGRVTPRHDTPPAASSAVSQG